MLLQRFLGLNALPSVVFDVGVDENVLEDGSSGFSVGLVDFVQFLFINNFCTDIEDI